ncbi:MAG: hypothetical protein LLF94_06210 [Chlamydiales bacterium]|nr:hypothetical protein [Chlamydiales bacterium]
MTICRLNLAFTHANNSAAFLSAKNETISITTNASLAASPDAIFTVVRRQLAATVAETTRPAYDACLQLARHIYGYGLAHRSIIPQLALQVDTLMQLVLLKAQTATNPEDLTCETANLYYNQLINQLSGLSQLYGPDSFMPKRPFDALREQVFTFLRGRMGETSDRLFHLEVMIFGATVCAWEAKARTRITTYDENSQHAIHLLNDKIEHPAEIDFETLTYPRTVLFIEKMIYHRLLLLVTIEHKLNEHIAKYYQKKVRISYEKVQPNKQAIIFEPQDADIVELGLFLQTKKACCSLVKHGIGSGTETLLKKLLAYKAQPDYKPDFYNLCIDMLIVNEIVFHKSELHAEWQEKSTFTRSQVIPVDKSKRHFSAASYLPRKRLKYLYNLGDRLHAALQTKPEEQTPESIHANFVFHNTIAIQNLQLLRYTFPKFIPVANSSLYARLACKISEFRNLQSAKTKGIKNFVKYEQFPFYSPFANKVFTFDIPTAKGYVDIVEEIKTLVTGRMQDKIGDLLKELDKKEPKKSFIEDLPTYTRRSIKPRKPNSTASRSPSPNTVTPPAAAVEVVTESLANVTLATAPPVKPLSFAVILPCARRVNDWFFPIGHKRDPFVHDPKYRDKVCSDNKKMWIRIKHSFARAVDNYLQEAVPTDDPEVLKMYNTTERKQLVGEIIVDTPTGQQKKQGIFTYTGKQIFHRFFTQKNSREIVSPDLHKGWDVLKKNKISPVIFEDEEAQDPASDDSYVESETPNLVVIVDPKNNARIRLVRLMQQLN